MTYLRKRAERHQSQSDLHVVNHIMIVAQLKAHRGEEEINDDNIKWDRSTRDNWMRLSKPEIFEIGFKRRNQHNRRTLYALKQFDLVRMEM